MEKHGFNTEDFIRAVHEEPALWDSRLIEYSDKATKNKAWDRLYTKFVENFNELDATEQADIVSTLQRKWKSLRDSYNRELVKQKSTNNKNRKGYKYFHDLKFLDPIYNNKKKNKNVSSFMEEDTSNDSDGMSEASVNKSMPKKPKLENEIETQKEIGEYNPFDNIIKFKYPEEDIVQPKITYDEETMFLLSLVPELRKVPDSLKLDVKLEIMNILKRACSNKFEQHFLLGS